MPSETIPGGRRVAIRTCSIPGWMIAYSPRNCTGELECNCTAEGPWNDWVELAHNILKEDDKRKGLI